VALAILASAFTTTAFAAPCDTSATLQFVGVVPPPNQHIGPMQLLTLLQAEASAFHLFSVKVRKPAATKPWRFRTSASPAFPKILLLSGSSGTPLACNVFAYYSVDSTIGVRAYFAAQQLAASPGATKLYNSAGVLPCLAGQGTEYPTGSCQNTGVDLTTAGFCTGKCAQGQVGGLSDTDLTLPHFVYVALTTPVLRNRPPRPFRHLTAVRNTRQLPPALTIAISTRRDRHSS